MSAPIPKFLDQNAALKYVLARFARKSTFNRGVNISVDEEYGQDWIHISFGARNIKISPSGEVYELEWNRWDGI